MMDHPWQELLFYLYNDGLVWLRDLGATDWRRLLIGQHGAVEPLNLQVMTDKWQVQNHIKGISNPSDVGARKGFVVRPCKHADSTLTILAPFIMANGASPRLSLQLGVLDQSDGAQTFFGYRFESPEVYEEHAFHHAQPVQAFGHGQALGMSANWYPNRYPSFPLAAQGGAELVATVLVSIREWLRLVELAAPSSQIPHGARQVMAQFLERIRSPQ